MKSIIYPINNLFLLDDAKKLIGFASDKILGFNIQNTKIEINLQDDANEELVIANLDKLLHNKYTEKSNETIFTNTTDKKYYPFADLKKSSLLYEFGNGLYGFNRQAAFLFRYFEETFRYLALSFDAVEKQYPVLLPIEAYQKTGYLKNSPQYAIFCSPAKENINELEGLSKQVAPDKLGQPSEALSPAACLHSYAEYENCVLESQSTITFLQNVFRNEGRFNWDEFGRLKDYHVREIVFIGSNNYVAEMREKTLQKAIAILRKLNIISKVIVASDPFVLPEMQKFKKIQLIEKAKYELKINYSPDNDLSCASFNLHGTAFTYPFNISVKGCEETVTGCVGFGIERWVLAFLCQYGTEIDNWPETIRRAYENGKCS